MFYDTRLLSKSGRLGEIWLIANHSQKPDGRILKIILETDIHRTIQTILESNLPPLSLRLYAYLLHGVIKLYHHKVVRLYEDASKSLSSITAYRQQEDITTSKKVQSKKDEIPKDRYMVHLDLTIPDIAGLDIIQEMELLHDVNIAPLTAITHGDVEDREIEFISTPSAADYLGDFDPHHYQEEQDDEDLIEPEGPDVSIITQIPETEESRVEEPQIGDQSIVAESLLDVTMGEPSGLDIFEADISQSQIATTQVEEDDEAQKNADQNDIESFRPRTVVIRPDKNSLVPHRKIQGNVDEYDSLLRDLDATPTKRRKLDEEIEELFDLPNIITTFDSNLIDLFRSSFDYVEPYEDLPKLSEEELEMEVARRDSSVAPQGPLDQSSIMEEKHITFEPEFLGDDIDEHEGIGAIVEEPVEPPVHGRGRTLSVEYPREEEHTPIPKKKKKKEKKDERFESSRTQYVHSYLNKLFKKSQDEKLSFSNSLQKKSKATVSQIFYEVLVLKSMNVVELEQSSPSEFTDILVSKTEHFNA